MKRNYSKKIFVSALAIIIVLLLTMTIVFSSPIVKSSKIKYNNESSAEIANTITNMSFEEICQEVNDLSEEGAELSDFITHASVLSQKSKDYESNQLVEMITDTSNSENLRIILLQILEYNEVALDSDSLSDLHSILKKQEESESILQNIIWILPHSSATNKLMEYIALGNNDGLAFQALRRLNMDDSKKAVMIANDFLKNNIEGERKRIAIMVISQDLRKSSDEKKKNRWVSYCNNELNKSVQSNDYSLTSTIIISLSDMRYIGALSYLIESDLVEETMKSAAISKNYKTIIDALSKEPTDKVIKTAIKAMEIRPISETIYELKKAIEKTENNYDLTIVLSKTAEPANKSFDLD